MFDQDLKGFQAWRMDPHIDQILEVMLPGMVDPAPTDI
jgi:hypothetical protein